MQPSNMTIRHERAQDGHKTYFTGKPCKRGHLCPRYVSNGACTQCLNPLSKAVPAEYVFTPPPVILFEPISREHAELLKSYFLHWTDQTLKGWGYRTFADGPIVVPYEFTPRTPQGPARGPDDK